MPDSFRSLPLQTQKALIFLYDLVTLEWVQRGRFLSVLKEILKKGLQVLSNML